MSWMYVFSTSHSTTTHYVASGLSRYSLRTAALHTTPSAARLAVSQLLLPVTLEVCDNKRHNLR
eukprot:COSAG01_NODE_7306_length_3258_cov_13.176638_2_plen_64_part_00